MARHRNQQTVHDHDYEVFPTSAGLVRLICRDCGQVGVGLAEEFAAGAARLRDEEARSILEAITAAPAKSPWPEPLAS